MRQYEFHTPCAVNPRLGTKQLASRIKNGYQPLIIANTLDDENVAEIQAILRKNPGTRVSFDIDTCGLEARAEDYERSFAQFARLRESNPEQVSPEIKSKFKKVFENYPGLASRLSAGFLDQFLEKTIQKAIEVAEFAERYSLKISYENVQRANFSKATREADDHPRWNAAWSATPTTGAILFANPEEIQYMIDKIGIQSLPLDLEHLSQNTQWRFLFNLDRGDHFRYADYSPEEKKLFRSVGLEFEDDTLMWDYREMTDEEHALLEKIGYTARLGEPIIYKKQRTLTQELQALSSLTITEATPGFQVYQGFLNRGKPRIGSHMPGIRADIIEDKQIRDKWRENLQAIYCALFKTLIAPCNITKIELEPVCFTRRGPIHDTEVWEKQMAETKRQAIELLTEAEKPKRKYEGPFYL